MNYSTQHTASRIDARGLQYTVEQLTAIAAKFAEDTAVIIGKRASSEGMRYGMELIILIVRNSRPATIMTRRQSQNFDKRNFNVSRVVYL
jgi:hypothetical protein